MKYSLILVSATVVYAAALPEVDTEGLAKRGDKEGWGILKDCHQQDCGKLFFKEPTEAQKKEYDGYEERYWVEHITGDEADYHHHYTDDEHHHTNTHTDKYHYHHVPEHKKEHKHKPLRKPFTKPTTKPTTKPATKPVTKPERKPLQKPQRGKPQMVQKRDSEDPSKDIGVLAKELAQKAEALEKKKSKLHDHRDDIEFYREEVWRDDDLSESHSQVTEHGHTDSVTDHHYYFDPEKVYKKKHDGHKRKEASHARNGKQAAAAKKHTAEVEAMKTRNSDGYNSYIEN